MSPRVRAKGTRKHRARGGAVPNSTPATSSSRTSAARPSSSTGISASVSRIALGSTGADSSQATRVEPTPSTRTDPIPANRVQVTRTPTPASRVGKTKLYITEDGFLMPQKVVPQACTRIFKKIKNSKGYTWTLTEEDIIKNYWEEFQKYFWWDEEMEAVIYDKWYEKAGRRYRDFVHGMKWDAMEATDKIAAKPPYITEADWLGWLAYWEREDVKKKSAIAKRCRMSEPEGPGSGRVIHRGGSKSIVQFAYELAAKKGCSPRECLYDAYCMSHQKKDGTYTDAKSARIGKQIEERVEEMRAPLPGTTEEREVDWNQAFLDVVPLDAKNRMFGTGELARIIAHDSSVGTSQYRRESESRITQMETQLAEEREERQRLTAQTQKMQEELENQKRQIEQLLSQSQTSSLAPP